MHMDGLDLSGVQPEARPIVEAASAVYLQHLRPWLLGLLLHGSALKGGYIPGCSDIDRIVTRRKPLRLPAHVVRRVSLPGFTPFSGCVCHRKNPSGETVRKESGPMLRTVQFACTLPKAEADTLNAESGRIYTDMLVSHYRLYRKQGVWLTHQNGERWEDLHGGPTTLHAHSRDAAQQGFYKACKTARACRKSGRNRDCENVAIGVSFSSCAA